MTDLMTVRTARDAFRRALMLTNILFRLAYGVGALFSPTKMATTRLAADTEAQPEARLFVRGFGAHQVLVALLGLVGRRRRTIEKPAALAAVAIDLADMISAVAEARSRKVLDADLTGGLVFSAAGIATAGPVLLAQR
jgi:hypothetical protein